MVKCEPLRDMHPGKEEPEYSRSKCGDRASQAFRARPRETALSALSKQLHGESVKDIGRIRK